MQYSNNSDSHSFFKEVEHQMKPLYLLMSSEKLVKDLYALPLDAQE